jgi:hypothetical protein
MVRECLTGMATGKSPVTFPYILPPAAETINRTLGILRALGCVDANGNLNERGKSIRHLSLDANVTQSGVALSLPCLAKRFRNLTKNGCSTKKLLLVFPYTYVLHVRLLMRIKRYRRMLGRDHHNRGNKIRVEGHQAG